MLQSDYRVDSCDRDGLGLALDWAASEGWNPGYGDADSFFAADPGGFLLGRVDGVPVASISAVKYGSDFGFVGLYIVEPAHRGRGLGLRAWDAAMASLRGRCIGLDGVVAQQDNYRKSGFALAHRNVRYAGVATGAGAPASPSDPPHVVDLGAVSLAEIAAYDRQHFPAARPVFLEAWLHQSAHALGWRENGRLRGMGCVRACREGFKCGPLHADDPTIASALFDALAARLPTGAPLFLDLPEPNAAARRLAEARGMQPVFETARMYAGGAPALPLQRIFGITSFELG
jgi:hypothetical protein